MKLIFYFLLSFLPLLISSAEIKPDKILRYKKIGETQLALHLFEPPKLQKTDTRPAIVFFFGGGWNGGSPSQFYSQARALADLGMVAFAADYRVRSRHQTTPFECVKDGKSAVRWIRKNAQELGIDPKRIVASGGSAGGHVAACTGVIKELEEEGENLSISSRPNAMILFNPVLDTSKRGFGSNRFTADQKTIISPVHHLSKGEPATIIFHGQKDPVVPHENAARFTSIMKKLGNRCELHSFKDAKHGFFNKGRHTPKGGLETAYEITLAASIQFLESLNYLPIRDNGK